MSDIPPQVPPPSVTKVAPGGSGNWVKNHKGIVGGLAITGVVGLLFILKKKSSSSAAATGVTGSGGTSTGPAVYEIAPGSSLSSGASQGQQNAESQLAALTQAVEALAPGTANGTNTATAANASAPNLIQIGATNSPGSGLAELIPGQNGAAPTIAGLNPTQYQELEALYGGQLQPSYTTPTVIPTTPGAVPIF